MPSNGSCGVRAGSVALPPRFVRITTGGAIPEGATAHFSFAQGVYWTQAAGYISAADVLSSAASIIDGIGYTGEDNVTLIGAGLTAISANMTAVVRGRLILNDGAPDVNSGLSFLDYTDDFDVYNNNGGIGYSVRNLEAESSFGTAAQNYLFDENGGETLTGAFRDTVTETEMRIDAAFTITPTKLAQSLMGGDVENISLSATAFTPTYCSVISAFAVGLAEMQLAWESLTIYPVQSDAALPSLSTPLS